MKNQIPFRIQMTREAKECLTDISNDLGITQIHLTSRLLEWFAKQPDVVQCAALGLYPDQVKHDVAAIILRHIDNDPAATSNLGSKRHSV